MIPGLQVFELKTFYWIQYVIYGYPVCKFLNLLDSFVPHWTAQPNNATTRLQFNIRINHSNSNLESYRRTYCNNWIKRSIRFDLFLLQLRNHGFLLRLYITYTINYGIFPRDDV